MLIVLTCRLTLFFSVEPAYELGNSESTVGLAWLPTSPMCLATGTGSRWLRIYDLRGTLRIVMPLSIFTL